MILTFFNDGSVNIIDEAGAKPPITIPAGTPDRDAQIAAFAGPPAVPETVTNYQARAALIHAGLFSQVDTAVRAANDPLALAAWDYANNFYRDSTFISGSLAAAANITSTQIDDLFLEAEKIN